MNLLKRSGDKEPLSWTLVNDKQWIYRNEVEIKNYFLECKRNKILSNNSYNLEQELNINKMNIQNFQYKIGNIKKLIKDRYIGNTVKYDKIILDLDRQSKDILIRRFLTR